MPLLDRDPRWAARRRAATVLRSLGTLVTRGDLSLAAILELEAALSISLDTIRDVPLIRDRLTYMDAIGMTGPRNRLVRDLSAVSGRSNPSGLPLSLDYDDAGQLIGSFTARIEDEGPPGYMHGGLIAAMFDEFLGLAQSVLPGEPAMTGTLSVRYLKPVPLEQPMTIRLASVISDGRKRIAVAQLLRGHEQFAICNAVFVAPGPGDKH